MKGTEGLVLRSCEWYNAELDGFTNRVEEFLGWFHASYFQINPPILFQHP